MRSFQQKMDSSIHSLNTIQKKESNKSIHTQGLYSQTEHHHQLKAKSRKSQTLTQEKKISSLNQIYSPVSQYAQTYYQRHAQRTGGQYFEEPGMSASQHQYTADRVNINPTSLTNSKQSIQLKIKTGQQGQRQIVRMRNIIIQKQRCIRDITERLRIIMQQLQRYQLQSKVNQCYNRLMADLSRMFQMPDISIQDIRIQVSNLLQQKKSRQHSATMNQRKNVEQIQQLIDKLNNEVNMKNMLEIKLVDVGNQNTNHRNIIQTLNQTINQQNNQIKQIYDEMINVKQELEDTNRLRKSGSQSMNNQNKLLKIQADKILKQRDELQIQLRQIQSRLLDNQGMVVEYQSKYTTQIRKKDFQQQQLRKQLEISNNTRQRLAKENQQIIRQFKQIQINRIEIQQVNVQLRRQIQKSFEQKRLLEQQIGFINKSKQQIKFQLLSQQDRIRNQYQDFINNYKQGLYNLQLKLKQATQNERSRNQQIIQYKLLSEKLQIQLNERVRQIGDLNNSKSSISQSKIDMDQRFHVTIRELESIKHQRQLEIDLKSKQINQIMFSYQQIQRQLRNKQDQIQSMKRSYNSQSQSLDKVKKNLMGEYTKQHQLRIKLQEELRLKQNMLLQCQNRIQILQKQNSGNLASSQRLDSLMKGQASARKEAEKMKELTQSNIRKQRIEYQSKISQEHLKAISLHRQVDQLQMTVSKLEYKLSQNEQMITFLKTQLSSRDTLMKQIKDSYSIGGRQYQKLSLQLSTSHKDLRQMQHNRKIEQINSFVLQLQNTIRSKQSIIQKLNSQLGSIGSNFQNVFISQGSLNMSNQNIGQIQGSLPDGIYVKQLDQLKQSKRISQQKHRQYEILMIQKQQKYKQLISRYQNEISQLRKQIVYRQQQQNLRTSKSSISSQNRQMTVLQSQQIDINFNQVIKNQQLKYQQLEIQSNNQINQLKILHSNAIKQLQLKYNESREELIKKLNTLGDQSQYFKIISLQQKIEAQKKIKLLYQQIHQKDRLIQDQPIEQPQQNTQTQKQIQDLNNKLRVQSQLRINLQLQIKAYEQAIHQLRKQNIQQQKQFQNLKQKNLQTSFTKQNQINDLFKRQKESLQIIVQNKILQIKTMQSQNSQLKMQISALKNGQSQPRPRSIQYTRQLEQKTNILRQLQMQNSTLTITMDDLKRQLNKRDQKIYLLSKNYNDDKFTLEKQNIELISKIKILEIKIDQLTYQLNSLRQIKSNTLLSGKILGSLDFQNKLMIPGSINNLTPIPTINIPNLSSVNNSMQNQTQIDILQDKNYQINHSSIISHNIISNKSFAAPKQVIESNLGSMKPIIQDNILTDLIQTKQKIPYQGGLNSINNSQFTFNLANSGSQLRNPYSDRQFNSNYNGLIASGTLNNYQTTSTNSLNMNSINKGHINSNSNSKNSSRQYQGHVSPHQQRISIQVKEQTRPYFNKKPEISTYKSDLKQYYSPGKNYESSQYSPRTMLQTSKSLQKDNKIYNYTKVHEQTIKNKQKQLGNQIYDNNKYFSANQLNIKQSKAKMQTPINQPYSFNTLISSNNSGKVNLKQFVNQRPSEYFIGSKNINNDQKEKQKLQQNLIGKQIKINSLPNYEKGISMYQVGNNGKSDSCC